MSKATYYIQGGIRAVKGFSNSQSLLDFFNKNRSVGEYEIVINSNGGSVMEGWAMHDIIRNMSKSKPVTTIGYTVMSIATKPFLAGTKRLVSENVNFLIHNPYVPPQSVGGEAKDLERIAKSLRAAQSRSLKKYLEFCDVPEKLMREMMESETEFSAKELVEMGFATGIMQGEPVLELQQSGKSVSVFDFEKKPPVRKRNRFSGLKLIQQEMNKIRAKQIRTSPMQLWIALDDGRRVEIRTKHKGDKPMIGDPVFDEEGKLIREGELITRETGEKLIIADSVIIEIIDTTLESEPVQKFSRTETLNFVQKAQNLLIGGFRKRLNKENYLKKSEIKKLQRQLDFETIKDKMHALDSDLQAFRGKLKDELELINKMK